MQKDNSDLEGIALSVCGENVQVNEAQQITCLKDAQYLAADGNQIQDRR